MEKQGAFQVKYEDDEWLKNNPDVVDAVQGIDTLKKRTTEEKISTAKHYNSEHEVMARTTKLTVPKYSKLNIYLDSNHFKHFGVDHHMWGYRGEEFANKMGLCVLKVRDHVERELKHELENKTLSGVRFYGCFSALSLQEEKESACILWDSI